MVSSCARVNKHRVKICSDLGRISRTFTDAKRDSLGYHYYVIHTPTTSHVALDVAENIVKYQFVRVQRLRGIGLNKEVGDCSLMRTGAACKFLSAFANRNCVAVRGCTSLPYNPGMFVYSALG